MKIRSILLFTFLGSTLFAQQSAEVSRYIVQYKEIALHHEKTNGIPASITLAQGLVESSSGQSMLAIIGNNHFGIKCGKNWTGAVMFKDDDRSQECFRKYNSAVESFEDHSAFLRNNKRYEFLFTIPLDDYKNWAYGLKKAGYATDPNYPSKLIKCIEDNRLFEIISIETNFESKAISENENLKPKEPAQKLYDYSISKINPDSIFMYHNKRCVWLSKNYSISSFASRNKFKLKNLMLYNDLTEDVMPSEGLLYLEKKNNWGVIDTIVADGNKTLWQISQEQTLSLFTLAKLNHVDENSVPTQNATVYLRMFNPVKLNVNTLEQTKSKIETNTATDYKTVQRRVDFSKTTPTPPINTEIAEKSKPVSDSKQINTLEENVIIDVDTIDTIETQTVEPLIDEAYTNSTPENNEISEISFNDIIHIVSKGETLELLSRYYGIPVQAIIDQNHLKSYDIYDGLQLTIPTKDENIHNLPTINSKNSKVDKIAIVPTKPSIESTSNPTDLQNDEKIHYVKPGETLYRIAVNYFTSVEDIKIRNGLKNNNLEKGQKLVIPPFSGKYPLPDELTKGTEFNNEVIPNEAPTQPKVTAATPSTKWIKHTVVKNENLYRIALKYNVTMEEILTWNNLKSDYVYLGQKLSIKTQK